jgi:hypothetical protein
MLELQIKVMLELLVREWFELKVELRVKIMFKLKV